jgi:hypothetical protein
MYIPNTTNVATLKSKGDLELSAAIGTNGYDGQVAYGITPQWGLFLNTSYGNSESTTNSAQFLKHYFAEAGAQRMVLFETVQSGKSDRFFHVASGLGYGYTEGAVSFSNIFDVDLTYLNQLRGSYARYFIQPSYGITSNTIDVFVTSRISGVYITNLWTSMEADWQNSYVSDDQYDQYQRYLSRKRFNVFIEPSITVRGATKYIKPFFQTGLSIGVIPNDQTTFRHRPFMFILGLQADLNVLGSRKKE